MSDIRSQTSDFRRSRHEWSAPCMIDFHRLRVWQKAHALTLRVYRETQHALQRDKTLASQMRRAAASLATNIVEGCGAASQPILRRYLRVALESAIELEYHLLLAHDLQLLPSPRYADLRSDTQEVKKMLTGFIRRIDENEKRRSVSDV
jgi:four helix bundle protein